MTGSDSLAALPHLHWNPALTDAARSLMAEGRLRLERLSATVHAGLQLPQEMVADLQTSGFSPRECGKGAFAAARSDEDLPAYRMAVQTDTLPVRKTFVDWLLFRRRAKVREHLFGADGNLEIAPVEKQKRLHSDSRAELEKQCEAAIRERFPARPVAFAEKLSEMYVSGATENIRAGLRALRDIIVSQRSDWQKPYDIQAPILAAADELQSQAGRVDRDIERLSGRNSAPIGTPPPIHTVHKTSSDPGLLPMPAFTMLPLLQP
jgi:hypothetical protein